jgi:hypothetical protein
VNVKRTFVVEPQQLMFRALLDGGDAMTAQRRECAARDRPLERWMEEPNARDDLADNCPADAPRGSFDFGQFRHR